MKKTFLVLCLGIILSASNHLQARSLWAFLTYTTFNSPEGPFVETYLSFAGNSLKYLKLENGKYQASVNVLMTFKQNEEIKAFKKYTFSSPEIADTTLVNLNFIDLQRFLIPNGTYDFEIQLSDNNKTAKPMPYIQTVEVDFPSGKASMSGIELVKSYSKNETTNLLSKSGYDLVPYVFTFYPETDSKLVFYCELYHIDTVIGKDQKFLLSYYLETFESNIKLNEFAKGKKETGKNVNVLLSEFDIANLASGNYNLVVEARNQKNELICSKKLFVQRSNPNARITLTDILTSDVRNTFAEKIVNPDSLKEYINSTYPIASGVEKSFIRNSIKTADIPTLQQYLYSFWQRRNAESPEQAFLNYKMEVYKAQVNFGTPIKKGYETDRGRVFLQYGPPNARNVNYNEPSSYPYEIWQYYTLNNTQRNKKFVFYSHDMVTSDFTLLHSDAIGEIYEPRWRGFLRSRIYAPGAIDDTQIINAWGENGDSEWTLPTSNL